MGSSAKRKKEKAKDFQKTKLKVGKARPKNTNATDTSFAAKSIVLKQQSLSEGGRDAAALFNHNLSLLGSKSDTQRKDSLSYLTTIVAASAENLTQPPAVILAKAQPLILDGSKSVREQALKLLRVLPTDQLGSLDQTLLYTRAGMAHLSNDIRLSSLDILDWLLTISPTASDVMSCPGGWVKTLRTFQNLLSWHAGIAPSAMNGKWSAAPKTTSSGPSSNNKLLVHQLTTLSKFLVAGLTQPPISPNAAQIRAAKLFPCCQTDVHLLSRKQKPFGYLNLFGAARDVESDAYEDADERVRVFVETGLKSSFDLGIAEAKREGGEVGRAACAVEKALKLATEVG
ncbi:pre-rrna-processing protein ipi1 [Acrodontium crateriforme]|uniref:Pre-rRNA-processing protein n=1 Tax=Acrodontium crateriforme TaxID=150365 RepID=A0AAQ3R6V8_9PEZI|nr:pre-rrna-processing protein ipi1 [Acrodontium crateriforme]